MLASLQQGDKNWCRKKISAPILNITGKDRGEFQDRQLVWGEELSSLRLKSFGLQKLPLPLFTRQLRKITTTFDVSYISQ